MAALVAIVGRPNVGKSSLLNRLARRRLAIVDRTPGTTRDRVSGWVQHGNRQFELMDTGGIGVKDADNLTEQVQSQVESALAEADVVVFVTDVREGVTPLDRKVAERLRHTDLPVILVANKTDSATQEPEAAVFYSLGFGEPLQFSAREGYGSTELLDRIVEKLPEPAGPEAPEAPTLKLAVVGRQNVGKSTLINRLCGAERLIVSKIPGTTRDAVDVPFTFEGLPYLAIDTAGMRKRRKVEGSFEFYSQDRARHAVERTDVVLLMLDAAAEVSLVDKELASFILSAHKPVLLVVNKWDLVEGLTPDDYRRYLDTRLSGIAFAPVAFISALSGEHLSGMMAVLRSLYAQASVRVSTGRLNRAVEEAIQVNQPPMMANRTPRIYYATQVDILPPTIVAFVNDAGLFSGSYRHYLANALRTRLPYAEVPIRIDFRPHAGKTGRGRKKSPATKRRKRKPSGR